MVFLDLSRFAQVFESLDYNFSYLNSVLYSSEGIGTNMNDIVGILDHLAPNLGKSLNGPFSGIALKYIKNAVGNDDTELDKIKSLLEEPENLGKIKEVEKKFVQEMELLGVNVQSLGGPAAELNKSSVWVEKKPQILLSMVFISAYFIMVGAMFIVETSDSLNMRKGENSLLGELQILFGVLTAGVGQVLSYWFGGSKK